MCGIAGIFSYRAQPVDSGELPRARDQRGWSLQINRTELSGGRRQGRLFVK